MNEVLIIKTFVGGFNDKNIGHEVINFYKPDGDGVVSYIYVPPIGKVDAGKYFGVEKIIMVGPPENNAYPVLAVVDKLEKFKSPEERLDAESKTKYGGKFVRDIPFAIDHKDMATEHFNFIVPKDGIKKPNEKIFIVPATNARFTSERQAESVKKIKTLGAQSVRLERENPQHSVAYCSIDGDKNAELKNFLEDVKNWSVYKLKTVEEFNQDEYDSTGFLSFIDKENEEQIYTNMFYSILSVMSTRERVAFSNFILKEESALQENAKALQNFTDLSVRKEKFVKTENQRGRIDLLLINKEHFFILENKIKSALNGLYEDLGEIKTQLDKYENLAKQYKEENAELKNAQNHVIVFTPNYNANIDLYGKEKVTVITYSKLKDYFSKNVVRHKYFDEFLNALKLQSFNREEEINRRFLKVLSATYKSEND